MAWALFVFVIIAMCFALWKRAVSSCAGKFSNPNEMAQALLIGMPLWGPSCRDRSA